MDKTPISNRLHIGIFGRRNAGKSCFINALTDQDLAIVSEEAGTTTDPVYKTIEILPEPGPCVIIDTAGLDDEGKLGELRKARAVQVLNKTDLAVIIIDPDTGIDEFEVQLIATIEKRNIPYILVYNKIDLYDKNKKSDLLIKKDTPVFFVSSKTKEGILDLRSKLKELAPSKIEDMSILKNIIQKGDTVVLVIPVDAAMPKGRLILPEVQTLRSVLDEDAHAVVCKEYELKSTLLKLKSDPDLVITDSQVYNIVKDIVKPDIRLTSFSMLFARYKGNFSIFISGAAKINNLVPNDNILIAEACTHHPQDNDIGRKKIPDLLENKVGAKLNFDYAVAADFPNNLDKYSLIITCGSCMINATQVKYRIQQAKKAQIPITNYGIVFAQMNGILERTSWLLEY